MPVEEKVSTMDSGHFEQAERRTKIDTDRTVVDFVTHGCWGISGKVGGEGWGGEECALSFNLLCSRKIEILP